MMVSCPKYLLLLAPVLMVIGAVMAHAESSSDQGVVSDKLQQGLALAERVYNSDDPIKARSALTVEEQDLLDSVTQPGTFEIEFQPTLPTKNLAPFTGCWAINSTMEQKGGLFFNTIYTYWQTTQVCARNGRVTSVAVTNAGGDINAPGWRIVHAPTKSTKNVGWEGRGVTKYYFVFGAGGWDLAHPTNCLQLRLNANGHDYRYVPTCNLD